MAKTLLEFEGELLDVMSISRISEKEIWDEDSNELKYCLVFNPDVPENFTLRDLYFKFNTAEFREEKKQELLMKIGELEHVTVL